MGAVLLVRFRRYRFNETWLKMRTVLDVLSGRVLIEFLEVITSQKIQFRSDVSHQGLQVPVKISKPQRI